LHILCIVDAHFCLPTATRGEIAPIAGSVLVLASGSRDLRSSPARVLSS
jgi:hypothetical protein